jgi:thymidine phosphorylase
MDVPLGRMIGNSLEVIESIRTLEGRGPEDVERLSVLLAARMLVAAGVERDEPAAEARVRAALSSGAGLEKFRQIVERQGGDPRAVDDVGRLPSAPDRAEVRAPRSGFVAGLHAEQIGRAAVALGAGRARIEDVIDPGVGVEVVATAGTRVAGGDVVLTVHHRAGRGLAEAMPLLERAVTVSDTPPHLRPLVLERVTHV